MKPLALMSTIGVLLLVTTTAALSQSQGVRNKRPLRHDYGNVVMDNFSSANDIAPVVFNHWLHRAKYTCRLCHVDLGFAMAAGETGVTEKDNRRGFYCGACHDGREAFAREEKGPAARAATGQRHVSESTVLGERHFSVVVHIQDQADIDECVDALRRAGVSILKLSPRRVSLEDVFLEILGKANNSA